MSSHNRCWIWGRHLVLETLRAGRWPILELLIGDRVPQNLKAEAIQQARRLEIEAVATPSQELTKCCRSEEHQGFAARMAPFPCKALAELMGEVPASGTIALLDRLQDSFNVGAIIRSASTLGVDGIIIGDKEQSEINSQVARSSAGSINYLPIGRTEDLAGAARALRDRDFQVVAASEKADRPVYEVDFRRPTLVVIGNEGSGIQPELLANCDVSVSIPMSGRVGSLNAAVAAGILFYEIRRQRSASSAAR